MADALSTVPPRVRSVPSVRNIATSLDRAKKRNKVLKEKANPGLFSIAIPTQIAAFGGGWLDSKQPDFMRGRIQASAAAGIALAVAGVMQRKASMLYAANGLLAIQAYSAGVRMAGNQVAIVEVTETAAPQPLSAVQ
jgi:hypothetical protein